VPIDSEFGRGCSRRCRRSRPRARITCAPASSIASRSTQCASTWPTRGPRPAVKFCYITGWRSYSEVFPLRWSQVDFKGGFVRLEPGTTKNREGRVFPLTPELRALLEQRLEYTRRCERAQDKIIPHVFHRKGQPLKYMRRSWTTACKNAGVPGRLLHDLRRSAVRNLERAGVSRSVAMKMTGHKTESVYRRYAIVSESDLREAAAKLAAATAER